MKIDLGDGRAVQFGFKYDWEAFRKSGEQLAPGVIPVPPLREDGSIDKQNASRVTRCFIRLFEPGGPKEGVPLIEAESRQHPKDPDCKETARKIALTHALSAQRGVPVVLGVTEPIGYVNGELDFVRVVKEVRRKIWQCLYPTMEALLEQVQVMEREASAEPHPAEATQG